jgi:phage baseplate assembly protein gpV
MQPERELADHLKRLGRGEDDRHAVRYGVVKDVDPKLGLVKVEIHPEGTLTDFIRYTGPGIAFGKWKGIYLPAKETEVLLLATDPDCRGYIAIGGLYNADDLPPQSPAYDPESLVFEHAGTGNRLTLDNDGLIYLGVKAGSRAIVLDTWILNTFNTHTHLHPMGPTSVPTSPWSAGDVTTKTKGL